MRTTLFVFVIGSLALGVSRNVALAQSGDVNKILADARAALGGEKKLSAVKTFAASGTATRVTNNQSMPPGEKRIALYTQMQQIIMEEAVVDPMFQFVGNRMFGPNLGGYYAHPVWIYNYIDYWRN
jgi:hypothetical protein